MAEPVNMKTLGGLTYNANQVKSAVKNKNGTFTISFKTGEKLTYPKQPDYKEYDASGEEAKWCKYRFTDPKVYLSINDNIMYDDTNFILSDVTGATFTSHKDTVSHVKLYSCEDTTVNLAANDSKVFADTASIMAGENNKVILDDNDRAWINFKTIKGRGTAAQKDY